MHIVALGHRKARGIPARGEVSPQIIASLAITVSILQFSLSFLYSKNFKPVICRVMSQGNTILIFLNSSYFLFNHISSFLLFRTALAKLLTMPCLKMQAAAEEGKCSMQQTTDA